MKIYTLEIVGWDYYRFPELVDVSFKKKDLIKKAFEKYNVSYVAENEEQYNNTKEVEGTFAYIRKWKIEK